MEMSKRMRFYGLVGLGVCLVFLLIMERNGNQLEHQKQQILAVGRTSENQDEFENVDESSAVLDLIQQVLNLQRRLIRDEMIDYRYPNGKYNISARDLDDLVLEKGGRPIRSIIITTWRSGSTFLGDVFDAHPENFYWYEPLMDFDTVQIRGPPLAAKALKNVRALLNCEYADLGDHIEWGEKGHPWLFDTNTPLWRQCLAHKSICYNHRFLSGMCKLFPFQLMKLTRLRLRIAQELLADEKLISCKISFVSEGSSGNPSIAETLFCLRSPDCSDPALLCADMVSDYNVAVKLQEKYPNTFKVMRYEDLAVEPYKHVGELTKFYGLDFHPNIKKFLDTHTKNDVSGMFSTLRNSKTAPFHWRTDLEFEEVEEIQRSCVTAMKRWGYVPAMNATHQRKFNPVTNYVLS